MTWIFMFRTLEIEGPKLRRTETLYPGKRRQIEPPQNHKNLLHPRRHGANVREQTWGDWVARERGLAAVIS